MSALLWYEQGLAENMFLSVVCFLTVPFDAVFPSKAFASRPPPTVWLESFGGVGGVCQLWLALSAFVGFDRVGSCGLHRLWSFWCPCVSEARTACVSLAVNLASNGLVCCCLY